MKGQKDGVVFSIDFQNNFREDVITVQIENITVIDGKKISSDEYDENGEMIVNDGFTGVTIEGIQEQNKTKVLFEQREFSLDNDGDFDTIALTIGINGQVNKLNVELAKGKYIGLAKEGTNKLRVLQSDYPFEYD